ncbi:hypothetical protein TIFTF001_014279 [Ficus carica]|uniref:Uncharacterized protein n=1 Tax=Ficus carica TaxID=3494 RepID=A0AA88A5R9_FICCA|nr:hypothetical protein TIFTF001_014279 [Ficus carica]
MWRFHTTCRPVIGGRFHAFRPRAADHCREDRKPSSNIPSALEVPIRLFRKLWLIWLHPPHNRLDWARQKDPRHPVGHFRHSYPERWACVVWPSARTDPQVVDFIGEEDTAADEDIKAARNTHEPIQVPVGPVTRAQAKRFKEELNNLVWRVLQQEESVFTTEGEQRLVLLIKVDPEESQSAIHVH